MKIICTEEHITDADLGKAGQHLQQAEAPYLTEVGSIFPGRLEDGDDKRPLAIDFKISVKLSGEAGEGRLAEMDKHGIDVQILSYSNQSQSVPAEQAVALTRQANDKLAAIVKAHPSRFGGFASLPWQDPKAAAEEAARVANELGLQGVMLVGRPSGDFVDHARYEPVLAKLSELRIPLYLHPGYVLRQVQEPYYGGLSSEVTARLSLFAWGWHNEAGIQLMRLLLSGKFDKFPGLRVISGHWGEMVPFYLQRLDDMIPKEAARLSRTITETFQQQVYVTPSGMTYLPHFEFIYKVLGADRILYSVDYPYLALAGARRFLENLPVNQEEKEKIAFRNAEQLFRHQWSA